MGTNLSLLNTGIAIRAIEPKLLKARQVVSVLGELGSRREKPDSKGSMVLFSRIGNGLSVCS